MVLFFWLSFCVSAHHLCHLLSVGVCTAARVEAERSVCGGAGLSRVGYPPQLTSVMALQLRSSSSSTMWQLTPLPMPLSLLQLHPGTRFEQSSVPGVNQISAVHKHFPYWSQQVGRIETFLFFLLYMNSFLSAPTRLADHEPLPQFRKNKTLMCSKVLIEFDKISSTIHPSEAVAEIGVDLPWLEAPAVGVRRGGSGAAAGGGGGGGVCFKFSLSLFFFCLSPLPSLMD